MAWLNSLYDATEPLADAQDDAKDYEVKLDDMRTVLENTMETLFNYDGLYNHINGTFAETKNQCAHIKMLHDEMNETITEGKKLIDEARGLLIDTENDIQVNRDVFMIFFKQFITMIIMKSIPVKKELMYNK